MMHIRNRTVTSGWRITLLLAAMVVGCVSRGTVPPTTTPPPMPEAMTVNMAGRLVSRRVASPPVIDGRVDAVWEASVPLRLPLTWGWGGTEHALDVELRALYTDEAAYFLAQWPGEPPSGEEDTVFNKLTVHWRIPEAAASRLDCNVACHTAFADGQGRFVYANAETIPQGGSEALPAAGGWSAGIWTLEWSRPLINGNPFDLQFTDLDQTYLFLVKVFERVEGRPDPVSERHLLVFQP